jgi:hypothetical protein
LLVFQIKLAIVCTGAAWAIATHAIHGLWLDRRPDTNRGVVGVVSILLWMFALVCGRLIAFFD